MKLSPDSPELTAYALKELPPAQRAAVKAAVDASPELSSEVEALQSTADLLTRHFAEAPAVALVPEQRREILRHGQETGSNDRPLQTEVITDAPDQPSWWQVVHQHWIWWTAAVAALAVTASLWPHSSSVKAKLTPVRESIAMVSKPTDGPIPSAPESAGDRTRMLTEFRLVEELAETKPGLVSRVPSAAPPAEAEQLFRVQNNPFDSAFPTDNQPATDDDSYLRGVPPASFSKVISPGGAVSPSAPVSYQPVDQLTALSDLRARNNPQELRLERFYFDRATTPGTESYAPITESPFKSTATAPLSTFGLDVDTASYSNVRRFLREGSLPPPDAVRLEELINYFSYHYPAPRESEPFASAVEITDCPWNVGHRLVRIGIQAKSIPRGERPRANLVLLLDVSGSMEPENKLPLVKRSLRLLLDRLGERDTVGIVTYAGESRVALEPTPVTDSGRQRLIAALDGLRAGSGTAGSVGIQNAYTLATNQFIAGGVNRVLLCTDGDFNLGITDPGELQRLIEEKAKSGVFLSVLGYGMGNTKDSTMEMLADKGNGNYAYVDSFAEARKVLVEQLEGTLVTVAKDVKVQVEFNPARVRSYRLLGYENRQLRDRDFNDDTKDAGEVGAGHQVTMLYEIEPAGPILAGTDPLRYQTRSEAASSATVKAPHADELLNLKIRYKAPDGAESRLIEAPVKDVTMEFSRAGSDLKFAAAVAGYGMLLRNSPERGTLTWDAVLRLAEQGLGPDQEGYRAEFVDLARKAQQLSGGK